MKWTKLIVVGLLILILSGIGVKEWRESQIVEHREYRFNMAMIARDSGITFVSFDPAEKALLTIPFPSNLAINSQSQGEYLISSLYKLGSYKGQAAGAKAMAAEGGMFVRQKIQGFMRVPVPGYLVVQSTGSKVASSLKWGLIKTILGKTETSLSRFDALVLLYRASRYRYREVAEDELTRAGVIDKNVYHPERLQEYVGARLFDWGIGAENVSVAIVNESGENGLGSDLADFLSNLGLDVVMVRSAKGSENLAVSQWQVADKASADDLSYIFQSLFGFNPPKLEKVGDEYRAKVLVRVGRDARELF